MARQMVSAGIVFSVLVMDWLFSSILAMVTDSVSPFKPVASVMVWEV